MNKQINLFFLAILLIFPNLFLFQSTTNDEYYLEYNISYIFDLKGNMTGVIPGVITPLSLFINITGSLRVELLKLNESCFNSTFILRDDFYSKINFIVISGENKSKLYSYDKEVICLPLDKFIISKLNELYANLTFLPKNLTNLSQNYEVELISANYVKYKEIYDSMNVTLKGSYNMAYKEGKNEFGIHLNFSYTGLNSLIYNIPIKINSKVVGSFINKSEVEVPLPIGSQKSLVEIKSDFTLNAYTELIETNFKLGVKGELQIHNFLTSTNTTFYILTNSTIERILIQGNKMNITTSNTPEVKEILYILYGNKGLIIDFSKLNVTVNGSIINFYPLFYLNYNTLSLINYNSSKTISLSLGANVGYYEYKKPEKTVVSTFDIGEFFQQNLYIIVIIVIGIILLSYYFLKIRRK